MNRVIAVHRDVYDEQRCQAAEFRRRLERCGTLAVNVLSSPGAGKTSLLEALAHAAPRRRAAVLVGDIATQRDAERLARWMPAVQLTTGGACHLELPLVVRGYDALPTHDLDVLFIENVGNLVCPSSHDLGEHLRVVLLSTTEGDDKPGKYPKAFRTSDGLVINKIDLLPYVPFSVEAATADARVIRPDLPVWAVSAHKGVGIAEFSAWLDRQQMSLRERGDGA